MFFFTTARSGFNRILLCDCPKLFAPTIRHHLLGPSKSHTHPTATASLCVSPHLQAPDPLRTTCLSVCGYLHQAVFSLSCFALFVRGSHPFPWSILFGNFPASLFYPSSPLLLAPARLESHPTYRNTIHHYMYYSPNISCRTTLMHLWTVTCLAFNRPKPHTAIIFSADTNSSTSASM